MSSAPSPLDLLRTALPGGYAVDAPIARGGQGFVFRGTWRGTPVALKLFNNNDERLTRELDLLARTSCPYLVKVLDYQTLALAGHTIPMVAYEYVNGPNLRAEIAGPPCAPSALSALGEHVGAAVEHLWSHRIVHRDIKPENVIAAKDGRYVLVDVGLAQHLDLSTITVGGQPGTTGYRSPEQCGGRRRLTIHSDVFSLGVTLFEVATKQHPWNRNQIMMGRVAISSPLSSARPDLDARASKLILEMLHSRPGMRPTDPGRRFASLRGP